MDRNCFYIIALTLLITLITSLLASMGEWRLEAYVNAYTAVYLALSAILRPKKRFPDFLAVVLLIIFIYTVIMKALEVLITT